MFGHNPLTYGNIGNLLHRAETKIFMGTQYDQDTTDTSMDVRIKWDYATESYHWIASPYTNWQDTGVTKANQVKTVDTEQDGAVSGGIQRRLEDGYGLKFESLNPDEMETVSHSTALNSFEKHTNKSLYPGLEAQHEDFCYYWSKAMNVAEQIESLEDRLGEGDEGKGNGHQVNAYIKSPNGDDTDDNTTQGEKTEQGTSWRMGIVAVIVIGGVFALTSQYR
mgnify:CR=1 FL=1